MHKEFIHIVRDSRTLIIVLIMPVSMLFLIGYAVAVDIDHIPTAVFDQSRDRESRALLEKFWQSGFFDFEYWATSQQEIQDLIDANDVRVGIVIPPNFAADLEAGRQVQVQLLIDGAQPNVAQVAQFAAEAIGQVMAVDIIGTRIGGRGGLSALVVPIILRPRMLYNPNLEKVDTMIPALIGLILQFQSVFVTAFAIVREREQGTLEQLIVTPIKSWELILGKITPFVMISFLNVGLTLLAAYVVFGVPFHGSLLLLLTLSIVFLLGSLGMGVLISTVSQTQMQAAQLAAFIMLPAFVISGFFVPRDNMPLVVY
jgi:ABC-2 type transport system permease protein